MAPFTSDTSESDFLASETIIRRMDALILNSDLIKYFVCPIRVSNYVLEEAVATPKHRSENQNV
jgi:hypothetical protein